MGTHRTRLHCFILVAVFLATTLSAYADPGKDLFDKQCASCHTIGGGDSGGPDLKGIAGTRPEEWLVKLITEPGKLTAAKDPVQALMWLTLSAGGFPASEAKNRGIATRNRDQLAATMTAAQIAEAQKLARAWRPR